MTLDQHSQITKDFDNMNKELFFYGIFSIETLFSKLF